MNVNLQGAAKIHWTQTLMLQMLNEIVSAEQKIFPFIHAGPLALGHGGQ